jgi:spore maturation protein CgeB
MNDVHEAPLRIVILGLSITSSWGNGHATNFRALTRALTERGHDVLFLERDVPWYATNRDLPQPPWGTTRLYRGVDDLRRRFTGAVTDADVVLVGSYVPDGITVGQWVTSTATGIRTFWDIDTPVTIGALASGCCAYLTPDLAARFDVYLSFTGGPTLEIIERRWGARRAVAFHCMVDEHAYRPAEVPRRWTLGYLGTYSEDRQPALDRLLFEVARALPLHRFAVGGPQYPPQLAWPANVDHIDHISPGEHPGFYGAQAFTLNVTRAEMVAAGWSPSVRLFEAAACSTPIISDAWPGLEEVLTPGSEVLVAQTTADVIDYLRGVDDDARAAIGAAARRRVLAEHTATMRARQLEAIVAELRGAQAPS